MRSRVSAALATPRIVTAECDRELKCNNVGPSQKFSDMEHCARVKTYEISTDFTKESECRNGVATTSLEECIQRTAAQTCDGLSSVITNMERAGACGSSDLCLQ